jgi:hypothetical protein
MARKPDRAGLDQLLQVAAGELGYLRSQGAIEPLAMLAAVDDELARLGFEPGLGCVVGNQRRFVIAWRRDVGRYNDSALFLECCA